MLPKLFLVVPLIYWHLQPLQQRLLDLMASYNFASHHSHHTTHDIDAKGRALSDTLPLSHSITIDPALTPPAKQVIDHSELERFLSSEFHPLCPAEFNWQPLRSFLLNSDTEKPRHVNSTTSGHSRCLFHRISLPQRDYEHQNADSIAERRDSEATMVNLSTASYFSERQIYIDCELLQRLENQVGLEQDSNSRRLN
jgi:hypothetical protein